jgi:putative molybdopterin biosynthesis protein
LRSASRASESCPRATSWSSRGRPLRPAAIYDSNGPIVAAAVAENGGDPVAYGACPDDERELDAAMRRAFAECDALILSGGTSKGAGDLTHRLVSRLGTPGIVAHGVALKPGKPLCLAVCDGKAVVVLPGFPTSAMFTFHDVVAPVLRRLAGLPARPETTVAATVPMRVPSELGRTEFVMASLVEREGRSFAYPTGKGSGSITSFAQADGFFAVDALADAVPAGADVAVTLFSPQWRAPDLVIIGSHDLGLDAVADRLSAGGLGVRLIAVGSLGGLAAIRRGECDLAPIHLLDPATGVYNRASSRPGSNWSRAGAHAGRGVPRRRPALRGRRGRRCGGARAHGEELPDGQPQSRRRHAHPYRRLLGGQKPDGYWNQPRSHNAVAACVAQGAADWGVAIRPGREAYGLGFLPLAEEFYDSRSQATGAARRPWKRFSPAWPIPKRRRSCAAWASSRRAIRSAHESFGRKALECRPAGAPLVAAAGTSSR